MFPVTIREIIRKRFPDPEEAEGTYDVQHQDGKVYISLGLFSIFPAAGEHKCSGCLYVVYTSEDVHRRISELDMAELANLNCPLPTARLDF